MRDILVLIFWLWCATSVVILIRRVATTGSLRNRKAEPIDEPKEPFEAKLLRGPDAAAPPESAAADLGDTAAVSRPVITRLATLAEALEGIELPNGLVPVISDPMDPRNMLFSSSTSPAEVIGRGLADEIERLGYSIQPVDDETIQAAKDGAELEIRIHPDLDRARMRVGATLATLPESSIVVQMRLR